MMKALGIAVAMGLVGSAAVADVRSETGALLEAMGVPDLMEIMREEGISYGTTLEDELFPGQGNDAWRALVEQAYDAEEMYAVFSARFDEELEPDQITAIGDFFASDRGQRIVELEVSARRALLDDSVEEAAISIYEDLRAQETARFQDVARFIEVNDLVEQNVMGALNSNYAFYMGLIDGNAFPRRLSESEVLADVWSQEDGIRESTTEWAFSYLLMAYQPLSDEDLDIYTAMSETEAGRALNRALFAAYDELFVSISRDLGLGAARFMGGEDI